MDSLFILLKKIKERPGLYLGTASITSLRMFLVGYRHARAEMKISNTPAELDFYKNFQPWLQNYLAIRNRRSWDRLILSKCRTEQGGLDDQSSLALFELYTVGEEKYAFERFFELLARFQQRDPSLDIDPILLANSCEDTEQMMTKVATQNL